jgi:proteasome assembly chaperone (PAC2) family protein
MAELPKLNHPWLVAVWPGMGHVALNAGYYLLSKLNMHVIAEFQALELFDVDHVEVKNGIIQPGRSPRHRFFVWTDPREKRDLVVFLGESQPPIGKYHFCRKLIEYAQQLGVERVFTFAAMATQMHPSHRSRVYGAATDDQRLDELKRLELVILDEGQISGLNGVLLALALEAGLPGTCLLGEMPHMLSQVPVPKASLAILEVFGTMSGMEFDLAELADQARVMEEQVAQVLSQMEGSEGSPYATEEEPSEPAPEEPARRVARTRIEQLFEQAAKDRSKAFELKGELDQLGLFREYEDRFLDLFRKSE